MRATSKLAASRIKALPPGKHGDGAGLWLYKREDGGAQWILRVVVYGRRREMGLGSLADVGLADARREAEKWRAIAKAGGDPIKEREKERSALRGEANTLAAITPLAFEAIKADLKDEGKAGRWMSPVTTHVLPALGEMPITTIERDDILRMARPIWNVSPEAAKKAVNRLKYILEWADAAGHQTDLMAVPRAKKVLGRQRHIEKGIPAMPWKEVPAFYKRLCEDRTRSSFAMRLLILTAMRSGPVRMAEVDEFDLEARVWRVPLHKMKGKGFEKREKEIPYFIQPLSAQAIELVREAMEVTADHGLLFPGDRSTPSAPKPPSDMMMTRRLEKLGVTNAKPHGWRSSFKTWSLDMTDFNQDIVEMALAHVTGNAVERAYMRGEFVEKRRPILQHWSDHVTGPA